MKILIKSKVFIATFLLSYFAFFVITMWLFAFQSSILTRTNYGFPFTYYYEHCFGGGYDLIGLTANIIFAFILSAIIGFISSHFWTKFSSPEFLAKWYLKN